MFTLPRLRPYNIFAGCLVVLIVVLIAFPIGRMVLRAFFVDGQPDFSSASATLQEEWVPAVLFNTIILVAISTMTSLVIGACLAWLNERTDATLGIAGLILPILPLLIPSVALAIGWAFIGAPRVGFLNGLLAATPGLGRAGLDLSVNIYSWPGLIWVYTLHGVPYIYLIISAALRNLDPALEEASLISGSGMLRTVRKVSLPAIRPALMSAALLVAISSFALYSLPAIIATTARVDVLSVHIVRLLRNAYPPRLDQAVVLGLLTLVLVGGLWVVQRRLAAGGRFAGLGGRASSGRRMPLGRMRMPARVIMICYLACASLVPLAALVIVAFQPFWSPIIRPSLLTWDNFEVVLFENRLTSSSFKNSLQLALIGATLTTAVALTISIYTARNHTLFARIADGVVKAPATISALVISVGFLVTFSGPPFFLGGTLIILELAFIVIYLPSASITVDSAIAQISNDLWEASKISGAGEARTIHKIVVPLALSGLAAAWSIVFVHMMGDLSASALLAGVGSPVIGYAIVEIWDNGSYSQLAAFSTLMCFAITAVVACVIGLARFFDRRS
jgi:iron(III) transport system permease protein